jgi:hypothetical protein
MVSPGPPGEPARDPDRERVMAIVPTPIAARATARFQYVVRPAHGKWEIEVGDSGRRVVYATLEDAAAVALGAARLHWATCREPCGATLRVGDRVRTLVRFGE